MAFSGSPIIQRVASTVLGRGIRQSSPSKLGKSMPDRFSPLHNGLMDGSPQRGKFKSPLLQNQHRPASYIQNPESHTPKRSIVFPIKRKFCFSQEIGKIRTQSPRSRVLAIYSERTQDASTDSENSAKRSRLHQSRYVAETLTFSPDIDESPVFLSAKSEESHKLNFRKCVSSPKLEKVLFPETESALKLQKPHCQKKVPRLFDLQDLEQSELKGNLELTPSSFLCVPQSLLKPTTPPTGRIPRLDSPFRRRLMSSGLDKVRDRVAIIGRGGYGIVITAVYQNELAAVKVVRRWTSKMSRESLIREQNVYRVKHANVTSLFNIYQQDSRYGLVVMEYAGSSNLQKLIDDNEQNFDRDRILKMAVQVASGLRACHQQNIVHLDVKPANIIVNHIDHCKLSDFGCSRRLNPVRSGHTEGSKRLDSTADDVNEKWRFGGTVAYQAPELFRDPRSFTDRCDTYSLGITLWQIMSRELPYTGLHPEVVIYMVAAMELRPPVLSTPSYDQDIYQMSVTFWSSNPAERPTSDQVLKRLNSLA